MTVIKYNICTLRKTEEKKQRNSSLTNTYTFYIANTVKRKEKGLVF